MMLKSITKKLFSKGLGILLLVFLSFSVYAANLQYPYEPAVVELTGVVDVQELPGPPNYEDITKGDAKEKVVFLKLSAPIDVIGKANDDVDVTEINVAVIQMAGNQNKDWQQLKKGRKITVLGKLFHATTGHHRTKVLMDVKKIKS